MTERESRAAGGFPRRDDRGADPSPWPTCSGVSLAGLVIGVLALVVFDWAFASFGAGDFGGTNGWLAVILPVWLFWEDFRAWEFGAARVVAALVGGGARRGLRAAGRRPGRRAAAAALRRAGGGGRSPWSTRRSGSRASAGWPAGRADPTARRAGRSSPHGGQQGTECVQ